MFLDYGTMATNIVRWVKTRFTGCKSTGVMPNGLHFRYASDTELLLSHPVPADSRGQYHCHGSPWPQETSFIPLSTPTEKDKPKLEGNRPLNLEELECDVSVEGCGLEQGGGLRQEFSFTLYDLDGHGKITKDDIAGLVKTIYETLGQSVRVPHYGSKTIKVKLTVSPEKKVCKKSDKASSPTLPKAHELTGDTPNNVKWSSDFHSSKLKDQRRYRQERNFCRRRHSISSSGWSEDHEADVSEDDYEVPFNDKLHNPALRGAAATTIFSKLKRRNSSLHKRELRELSQIIQQEMEKKNLPPKKPISRHASYSSPYRDRSKMDELLGRKSVKNGDSSAQPEKRDSGKMFLNSLDVKSNSADDSRSVHRRSHSYDLSTNRCSVNDEVTMKTVNDEVTMKTVNDEVTMKKRHHPTTHELKHRYRAFDQARAKDQVVKWLEQEFSCTDRKKNNNLNSGKTPKDEKKSKVRSCSNEKREHHHIHRHFHHHYHHYHESPIII